MWGKEVFLESISSYPDGFQIYIKSYISLGAECLGFCSEGFRSCSLFPVEIERLTCEAESKGQASTQAVTV